MPIYGNPYPVEDIQPTSSALEEQIRNVRQKTSQQLAFVGDWASTAVKVTDDSVQQLKTTYKSLLDEQNTVGKAAFVTAGGLVGLTLAFRGGVFRKLMYGSIGVGSTAALCYPDKAHDIANLGFYVAINKLNPLIREQTGVDLQKHVQESMQRLHKLFKSDKQE